MKRVLFLVFGSRLGGAELALLTLLDGLDRRRFEHLVVVGSPGPLVGHLRSRGVEVLVEPRMRLLIRYTRSPLEVAANLQAFPQVVRRLVQAINRRGVSLVHAFVTPTLKYGGLAARLAGVPAVATMHDALAAPFTRLSRRVIATNVNRLYGRLIVPTLANRDAALRAGVRPNKLAIVRNGIDVDRFAFDAAAASQARSGLGVPEHAPLVGAIGRLIPLKGHDTLLRAMRKVGARRPDARCVIVGGAGFEAERQWQTRLVTIAEDLGVADRVIFAGWRDDVSGVLSALDVFVQPSAGPDSSPTAILEAMAARRPVVASAEGGIPELVNDGETGRLIPARDAHALAGALLDLLDSDDLRRAMGDAGRARAACHFSAEQFCHGVESVYEDLLDTPTGPHSN